MKSWPDLDGLSIRLYQTKSWPDLDGLSIRLYQTKSWPDLDSLSRSPGLKDILSVKSSRKRSALITASLDESIMGIVVHLKIPHVQI